MASGAGKLPLARCPRCREPLKEISYVPVYRCGGCNTILLANSWKAGEEADTVKKLKNATSEMNISAEDSDKCGYLFCDRPASMSHETTSFSDGANTSDIRNERDRVKSSMSGKESGILETPENFSCQKNIREDGSNVQGFAWNDGITPLRKETAPRSMDVNTPEMDIDRNTDKIGKYREENVSSEQLDSFSSNEDIEVDGSDNNDPTSSGLMGSGYNIATCFVEVDTPQVRNEGDTATSWNVGEEISTTGKLEMLSSENNILHNMTENGDPNLNDGLTFLINECSSCPMNARICQENERNTDANQPERNISSVCEIAFCSTNANQPEMNDEMDAAGSWKCTEEISIIEELDILSQKNISKNRADSDDPTLHNESTSTINETASYFIDSNAPDTNIQRVRSWKAGEESCTSESLDSISSLKSASDNGSSTVNDGYVFRNIESASCLIVADSPKGNKKREEHTLINGPYWCNFEHESNGGLDAEGYYGSSEKLDHSLHYSSDASTSCKVGDEICTIGKLGGISSDKNISKDISGSDYHNQDDELVFLINGSSSHSMEAEIPKEENERDAAKRVSIREENRISGHLESLSSLKSISENGLDGDVPTFHNELISAVNEPAFPSIDLQAPNMNTEKDNNMLIVRSSNTGEESGILETFVSISSAKSALNNDDTTTDDEHLFPGNENASCLIAADSFKINDEEDGCTPTNGPCSSNSEHKSDERLDEGYYSSCEKLEHCLHYNLGASKCWDVGDEIGTIGKHRAFSSDKNIFENISQSGDPNQDDKLAFLINELSFCSMEVETPEDNERDAAERESVRDESSIPEHQESLSSSKNISENEPEAGVPTFHNGLISPINEPASCSIDLRTPNMNTEKVRSWNTGEEGDMLENLDGISSPKIALDNDDTTTYDEHLSPGIGKVSSLITADTLKINDEEDGCTRTNAPCSSNSEQESDERLDAIGYYSFSDKLERSINYNTDGAGATRSVVKMEESVVSCSHSVDAKIYFSSSDKLQHSLNYNTSGTETMRSVVKIKESVVYCNHSFVSEEEAIDQDSEIETARIPFAYDGCISPPDDGSGVHTPEYYSHVSRRSLRPRKSPGSTSTKKREEGRLKLTNSKTPTISEAAVQKQALTPPSSSKRSNKDKAQGFSPTHDDSPSRHVIHSLRHEELSGASEKFFAVENWKEPDNDAPSKLTPRELVLHESAIHRNGSETAKKKIPERNHVELLKKIDEVREQLMRYNGPQGGGEGKKLPGIRTRQVTEQPLLNNRDSDRELQLFRSYSRHPPGASGTATAMTQNHMLLQMPISGRHVNPHSNSRQEHNRRLFQLSPGSGSSAPWSPDSTGSHQRTGSGSPSSYLNTPQSYRGRDSPVSHRMSPQRGHDVRRSQQRDKSMTGKRHCRPVLGGAHFVSCYECLQLLQMPEEFHFSRRRNNKLRCGECFKVLAFSLVTGSHVVPQTSLAKQDRR